MGITFSGGIILDSLTILILIFPMNEWMLLLIDRGTFSLVVRSLLELQFLRDEIIRKIVTFEEDQEILTLSNDLAPILIVNDHVL
jgi:hypothetical protein